MTTKLKHTDLPWRISTGVSSHIVREHGGVIALCHAGSQGLEREAEANASFIVLACNSYYTNLAKIVEKIERSKTLDELTAETEVLGLYPKSAFQEGYDRGLEDAAMFVENHYVNAVFKIIKRKQTGRCPQFNRPREMSCAIRALKSKGE